MATAEHTPLGRGWNKSLIYFHHMTDWWTSVYTDGGVGPWDGNKQEGTIGYFPECVAAVPQHNASFRPVDLWETFANGNEGPANGYLTGEERCSSGPGGTWFREWCYGADYDVKCPAFPPGGGDDCPYLDDVFTSQAIRAMRDHPAGSPLFLVFAAHAVHAPLQLPRAQLARFRLKDDWRRQRYAAMVNYFDGNVGKLVDAMKAEDFWSNGLVIFSSDNVRVSPVNEVR